MKKLSIYLTVPLLCLFFTACDTGQTATSFNDKLVDQFDLVQEAFNNYIEIDTYSYSELKVITKNAFAETNSIEEYKNGGLYKMAVVNFLKSSLKVIGENEAELLYNLRNETDVFNQLIEKEDEVIKQQKWFATINNIKLI
jgi:hypothetical protein